MYRLCFIAALAASLLPAADYRGQVEYGGLPLPGATVTLSRATQKLTAITDARGSFSFPGLADGTWHVAVGMLCFAPIAQDVDISQDTPPARWELTLLPLDRIKATATALAAHAAPPPAPAAAESKAPASPEKPPAPPDDLSEQAAPGFLVNGTENNGASSPFAMDRAFGNNRLNPNTLFNGGIGVILENSALDARPFSLTGQDTPKPAYNHVEGVATLGGVLKIPHVMPRGPVFFVGYQWTRDRDATDLTGLVPDAAMRMGMFSGGNQAYDVPQSRISPQARALLNLYPLPNFAGSHSYNYQIPAIHATHQDALQSRLNKFVNNRNQFYGGFAFQSTRSDTPNLFGFLDTTDKLGINTNVHWQHTIRPRLYGNLGYQFTRMAVRTSPFFANRQDISGDAGITGNNQDAMNWGPPNLVFASGISGLSDAQASHDRNQTSAVSYSLLWHRGRHNVTAGGDYRRLEFNYLAQQNPRGTFTFTGAATGYDFADFLTGIPDASAVAFGNADKYFRSSSYDAYVADDIRIGPELTVNAGLRWEYGAPITELRNRLVNLDITPGFTAAAPVLPGPPYPDSLVHPDKHGVEPRVGIAWRPLSGSSLVVRAGYGIEYNTSVYQTIAEQMAQQAPLSKSLSVQNSAVDPLTLASGFNTSPTTTQDTFAIDPHFRVGYVQNWKASVQRDFPGSLVVTGTYMGIKGTRGVQEFLPNTYPYGAADPCPACPRGFAYMTSNGNATREAGQIQVRRRLHSGLAASAQYTYSKSIDDAALGGRGQGQAVIAQNWLDLSAERGLSNFDQRHLLDATLQYTTGMGLAGGGLAGGWRGALCKEWTVLTQITAGSGLPETPIYLVPVAGTGVTGSIRPDYTGAPPDAAPPGLFLNPAAYAAPAPGEWGDAGRNSIIGPSQLAINLSLARTFRWKDRFHIDLRFDSANALNHVTFTGWNTTIGGAQFGLPVAANAMRSISTTLRLRF
ncbi:MAG TPA: carboxypeptidase regulatory-like domain-containing protein [Bryobacteraceae bacterium]|nr:carboxypeptidase regulatory-like domain-containing protein [Bryobacteraceae bacterium]